MAEIRFSSYSPAWQRVYRITQLVMCAACVVSLILALILWSLKPLPVVFFAAAAANGMEAANRFRKKRANKRQIGQTVLFAVFAALCLVLAAAAVFLLWGQA